MPAVVAVLLAAAVSRPPAGADGANPLGELVDAAAQRLQIAEPVAAAKWASGAAVEDRGRAQQQLAALAIGAATGNIDSAYATRVFTDQIAATEAVEYHWFAHWKLDPPSAPVNPPDLARSRATIDALNQVMLAQIGVRWSDLHAPECPDQLDAAKRDAAIARRLDAFEQAALSFATQSYCG